MTRNCTKHSRTLRLDGNNTHTHTVYERVKWDTVGVCEYLSRREFQVGIGIRNLLMSSYKFEFRQNFDRAFYLWTNIFCISSTHKHTNSLTAHLPLCHTSIKRTFTNNATQCTPKCERTNDNAQRMSSVTHASSYAINDLYLQYKLCICGV